MHEDFALFALVSLIEAHPCLGGQCEKFVLNVELEGLYLLVLALRAATCEHVEVTVPIFLASDVGRVAELKHDVIDVARGHQGVAQACVQGQLLGLYVHRGPIFELNSTHWNGPAL